MGNKLCKKKVDAVDNASVKSPTTFDRIMNRLHIRPSAWKSDSQLNQKQVNRYDISTPQPTSKHNNVIKTTPLSRSSDWTDVDLEVPEKEEHVHLRNPKLSIIFNNENGTPTPPPRKHKKNFREKIEAVAKSGLQAFQQKKPVEETICVKKTINYKCPLCDQDEVGHNRDHHHNHNHDKAKSNKNDKNNEKRDSKADKDSLKRLNKNLSVMSLPNYDELKMTVRQFDDIDKGPSSLKIDSNKRNVSEMSLPTDPKKPTTTGSTGKLDAYITRCRSFGSIFPQQLKKLRTRKVPAEIESDDSFGALEDWDLGLLEHYNPKDASLPRPRKTQRNSKEIMSDIESLIVAEEDIEKPKPPIRRSESLVKKINRENAQSAHKRSSELLSTKNEKSNNLTPPSTPNPKPQPRILVSTLPTETDGQVEHSSLMRILEQFSIKDKQNNEEAPRADEIMVKSTISSNQSSLTPSLLEFEKNVSVDSVEDFINAEKLNTDRDLVNNNFKAIVT